MIQHDKHGTCRGNTGNYLTLHSVLTKNTVFQRCRWRQYIPLKRWSVHTLHALITQKTAIQIRWWFGKGDKYLVFHNTQVKPSKKIFFDRRTHMDSEPAYQQLMRLR